MEQHAPRDRRKALIIALVVVVIIAGMILFDILKSRPINEVTLQGTIEATQVMLSSKISAVVQKVRVSEGDEVKSDEVIIMLRDEELRDQVHQAEAALAATRARLSEAVAGPRAEEIQRARVQVEQAQATLEGAKNTLALAEEAFTESRALKARFESARTNLHTAQAAYDQSVENLLLVRQGPRTEQIDQARALVKQAQTASFLADQELARSEQLFERGAISASQLDTARASAEAMKAKLDQAQAALDEMESGARPEEIRRAEASSQQAKAALDGAKRSFDIAREQLNEKLSERLQLTSASTQYETARAQLESARAVLQEYLAGTRQEQIDQLRAQVKQYQSALQQARTMLDYTVIKSPIDGTVITRSVEPGELASPGSSLIELADLREVKLKVYLQEDIYGRINLGQEASVTTDSIPDKAFKGHVTNIAQEAEFTPREIQTREQRVKLVYGVEITIPNPDGVLKPGMPAEAVLKLQPL